KERAERIVGLLGRLGCWLRPPASGGKGQEKEWHREQEGFHGTEIPGGRRRVGGSMSNCNNLRAACNALPRRVNSRPGSPGIAWALRRANNANPGGNPLCAWASVWTSCRWTPVPRPPATPGPRHTRPVSGAWGGFPHRLAGATAFGGLGRCHWLDSLPPPQGTGRLGRRMTLALLW